MNSSRFHDYRLAGLSLRSEIPFPELAAADAAPGGPDVTIRFGAVPESLPNAVQPGEWVDVSSEAVLVKVPGVARFLVSNGNCVIVAAEPGAHPADLRVYLLGSALGAIYFQRGFLPLHASVVVAGSQAVAFAGDSGCGKSTMAAWLVTRGYPLLCDDVCVVRFDRSGTPLAFPGYPRVKLGQDALERFRVNTPLPQPHRGREEKFHLPVGERFWADPVALGCICFLHFTHDDRPPTIESIRPARGVPLIRDNTYRYQYVSGLGLAGTHFADCVRLARSARLYSLNRPRSLSRLEECEEILEDLLQ